MPYAALPGVRLWYTDSGGSGAPVIFLHAASGHAGCWVHQLPAFTAAGFRCIAYDRRGWGKSQTDPSGQPGCASDDLHALIEQLGLDPCHLVATAAGGAVAVDYTLSHPDRVSSLVLADCSGGARDAGYVRLQEIIRPAAFEAWPAEMREVGPSYRFSNPEGTQRWAEIDHASQQPDAPRQTPRNHITFELLTTLRTPTLVLTGDADLYSPPSMMRQLAAAIPGSQHVLLPEAGHAAFWEQPDTWNRLVLDFIRQH